MESTIYFIGITLEKEMFICTNENLARAFIEKFGADKITLVRFTTLRAVIGMAPLNSPKLSLDGTEAINAIKAKFGVIIETGKPIEEAGVPILTQESFKGFKF